MLKLIQIINEQAVDPCRAQICKRCNVKRLIEKISNKKTLYSLVLRNNTDDVRYEIAHKYKIEIIRISVGGRRYTVKVCPF